mmetsp:Transcript_84519/g.182180  ORF Transcript_84519/g.182180 Transcript_84519/m.182180 type:complete len:436 (+) Transcript_84519:3-1310(+)
MGRLGRGLGAKATSRSSSASSFPEKGGTEKLVYDALLTLLKGAGIVVSFTCLGAAVGAIVGLVSGLMVGACFALLTLGLSLWIGAIVGLLVGNFVGGVAGCVFGLRQCAAWAESRLLYHPQENSSMHTAERWTSALGMLRGRRYLVERITYSLTPWAWGKPLQQQAYFLRPEPSGGPVDELWVLFGGNAMLATDWLPYCQEWLLLDPNYSETRIAFLLVDYPGYGGNVGKPSPSSVLEASVQALRTTLAQVEGPQPRINLLGHSLGAAAAAQLAVRLAGCGVPAGRLVMSAPFTDIPNMTLHLAGLLLRPAPTPQVKKLEEMPVVALLQTLWPWLRPLALALLTVLVPHRWANLKMLPQAARAGWAVTIVHGAKDTLVPPRMGCELCALGQSVAAKSQIPEAAARVRLVEVPEAGHNEVLQVALPAYAKVMGLVD